MVMGYSIGINFSPEPEVVTKTIVRYEQGDVDTVVIRVPEPYAVHDTITDLQALYVDTAKSIEDYLKVKDYRLDFSNDTLGSFVVETKIHKNTLIYAEAQIKPIIKTIEISNINKPKKIQFYSIIGTSINLKYNQIQLGVDYKDKYMMGVSGIRLENKLGYTLNFGMKF